MLNDVLFQKCDAPEVFAAPAMPVQTCWFDSDEYASELLGVGVQHLHHTKKSLVQRLRYWKQVPVIGSFIPKGVLAYQLIREEVRHILRDGITEGVDSAMAREECVVAGVESMGIPVRNSNCPVWMSPQFIASLVVMMRAQLGRMRPTEPNRHVAARSYAKICRDHGVRLGVQEQNRRMVMESFFKDDTMDSIADEGAVAPFWMRLVCGSDMWSEGELDRYDA